MSIIPGPHPPRRCGLPARLDRTCRATTTVGVPTRRGRSRLPVRRRATLQETAGPIFAAPPSSSAPSPPARSPGRSPGANPTARSTGDPDPPDAPPSPRPGGQQGQGRPPRLAIRVDDDKAGQSGTYSGGPPAHHEPDPGTVHGGQQGHRHEGTPGWPRPAPPTPGSGT